MGDSWERVGDTCWACCLLASVLRDNGLTPAGRCCGEEPGVLIPEREDRREGWALTLASRGPHTPRSPPRTAQSIRQNPLCPDDQTQGAPSTAPILVCMGSVLLLDPSPAGQHSPTDPIVPPRGVCPTGLANQHFPASGSPRLPPRWTCHQTSPMRACPGTFDGTPRRDIWGCVGEHHMAARGRASWRIRG